MLTPDELKQKLKDYSKVDANGCWVWQRSKIGNGYGSIAIGKQQADYAHRVSYRVFKGEIPDGHVVMHHCDIPACCNPDHLSVGTYADNMQDCIRKGRFSVPPIFHGAANNKTKLTEENVAAIVSSTETDRVLAARYGVTPQAIHWRRKQHDNKS